MNVDLHMGCRVESRSKGFTTAQLFWLLLSSAAALFLFLTLAVPKSGRGTARPTAALVQLHTFAAQLRAFRDDTGYYPPGTNGLQDLVRQPAGVANWHGPYAQHIPKDPWGCDYVYACPGEHTALGYPYDLLSLGPPGASNPIANWASPALKP